MDEYQDDVPAVAAPLVRELIRLEFEAQGLVNELKTAAGGLAGTVALNAAAKEKLALMAEKAKALERLAAEQDRETDARAISERAQRHLRQCEGLRTALRRANIAGRQAAERVHMSERAELLASASGARPPAPKTREGLVAAATDVTESLKNTARLMAAQLQQSSETMEALATSSKTVSAIKSEFTGFGGVVNSGRLLLTKMKRREVTDKFLVLFGVAVFACTVLYIVKKRVFGRAAPSHDGTEL